MASCDGETDSDLSNDDLYSIFAGSDINIDDSLGSFSSDTDGINDPNSQLSLETFSVRSQCPCFWSTELNPMSIAPFSEVTGPIYDLISNDNILRYFFLMVPDDFFERFSIETNRYAAQEFEKRGHRDADWFGTSPQEIETQFGLHILMGTNQLQSVDMYWSQNKFLGTVSIVKLNEFELVNYYVNKHACYL